MNVYTLKSETPFMKGESNKDEWKVLKPYEGWIQYRNTRRKSSLTFNQGLGAPLKLNLQG